MNWLAISIGSAWLALAAASAFLPPKESDRAFIEFLRAYWGVAIVLMVAGVFEIFLNSRRAK